MLPQHTGNRFCRVEIDTDVSTPTVRESVREHFDCSVASGAPLEGNGGQATSGSHWEASIFQSEIMIGASAGIQRRSVSPMTLGLAQDSGWYVPNWDAVGFLRHGHKAGCEMLVRHLPTHRCRTEAFVVTASMPCLVRPVALP